MLLGVVTWSRRLGPLRRDRDRVGRRNQVATARCVATSAMRQSFAWCSALEGLSHSSRGWTGTLRSVSKFFPAQSS
ncbi:hypothetical protein Taro_006620 [Colocasia esculenta]|uniref:Uncharacterized protein n=1 Tax=Colocasia esculenta TaxID=4460 RepID=A0A843U1B6_COLES|nr:hypothetical protein [Colocasia esculenta]